MNPTRTIPAFLLLAALLVSCSDAEPPPVEKPASPDDPPPHLVAKYGPSPAGGPTGRRKTVEGIEFIELKPGYFRMGSDDPKDENPRRWVEIPESFAIAKTEVTNEQFEEFYIGHERTEDNPDPGSPVVRVTIEDAMAFCAWASAETGIEVRLPKETEWEYACRAGTSTLFFSGDRVQDLQKFANIADAALARYPWISSLEEETQRFTREIDDGHVSTCRVSSFAANAWGLFDMHGNVWEICVDGRQLNDCVVRGGSWLDQAEASRSGTRLRFFPDAEHRSIGFRPVAIFPEEK